MFGTVHFGGPLARSRVFTVLACTKGFEFIFIYVLKHLRRYRNNIDSSHVLRHLGWQSQLGLRAPSNWSLTLKNSLWRTFHA